MEVAVLAAAAALAVVAAVVAAAGLRARASQRSPAPPSARAAAPPPGMGAARTEAQSILEQARADGLRAREEALDELSARAEALEATEALLAERARELQERRRLADLRREELDARRATLDAERAGLDAERARAAALVEQAAGIDGDTARRQVLDRVEGDLASDQPGRVARALNGRVGELVPSAQRLIADAIQRQDASHIDQAPRANPVSLEGLGEEARERLLAALSAVAEDTATDVSVDADRNQATLRGLDPVGREVARQASLEVLERRLRAEEVTPLLVRTRRDLGRRITELGQRALWEMGVDGRPELAELLGTLHYRFSYGQNALLHCQETGYLCAVLAGELRMDPAAARTAGLLHDIGKAVDHDVEGSHAIIGGELLTVLGVEGGIVHAVKAHHFDEEPSTDLAMLTICADAISASRPGARRDTLTTYLQRLDQLQQIATRHTGVERAFPMQAGREVRVAVRPDQVPDDRVPEICAEIAREIEAEMTYPGMIKVTVIRETAASATAS